MLLQGQPLLLLKKVEWGDGFEAWRLLVERYEGANASRFTGLARDSRHIGLRSSANEGGRADTTASQGQRRQGLGEEGLLQAAEEASRRHARQDLLRMQQAGTPREGLLEPKGVA